jgi:imidazolonepropionase-like amidohydrolase
MTALLTNLRLWDGLADTALQNAAVLLDGERIAWAGPASDAPAPAASADVVDCRGGTLLPGLIDAHMHFGLGPPHGYLDPLAAALGRAGAALEAGLTAVRDLGARDHSVIAAAREIAAGRAAGPHIVPAGRHVAPRGGYAPGVAVEVDGPDGVRAAVRDQIAAGAGVIKVVASPVPPTPDAKVPRSFGFENLAAAVEVAHAAGLRVAAHAHSLAGAQDAIRAGVDCIEHGYRLDAECIDEMARRGTWLVPTLVAMEAAQTVPDSHAANTEAGLRAVPRSALRDARAEERWQAAVAAVRQAHWAGVRIATGTDAVAIVPVDSVRREVVLLVEAAGLPPVAALRAATSAAADLLGIAADTGSVVRGRRADLLLVDGDPLADPAVLARVRGVWRAGRRV